MTDTTELKRRMDESGYRIAFIAKQCSLTYQGLSNKINNVTAFTAPEIKALKDLLKLSPKEVERIFFADNVGKLPTRKGD